MNGKYRAFSLTFEYNQSAVVPYECHQRSVCSLFVKHTCGKQVEIRVCSKDPESVLFPPESLDSGALGQVPNAYSFVFSARHD